MGNFLGDFVKGARVHLLPPPIKRGIHMHRAIDSLTDHDEDVRALNQLLKPRHGRYAGVITDIGFDYHLWRNWEEFGPAPFSEFTQSTYASLYGRREEMNERVRGYVNQMVKDDWLRLYTSREGMAKVFGRLEPRLSKPELLEGINDTLVDFHEEFNQTFLALFPRLQTLANAYRPDATPTD
ncbi:ACP phosphodiesterase [Neolewinella agarilytica]|nr:acyl carrier protein phosphodiesterase [Neolewinella agarilytica]